MSVKRFEVPLSIDSDAYVRSYSGHAKVIVATDIHGRTLQFPAVSLRPFVTREGICGTFIISVDDNNRLVEIRRKGG